MKKFIIERDVPNAGNLSSEELQGISKSSCDVIKRLDTPYHWIQSFVTDDKVYCIHIAESEKVIREHSKLGNFPRTKVHEVKAVIDPTDNPL
jgi:hypothetical protein